MGAIADKKFNLYGTGEGQIDIAKQMRLSGYVNQKDQITTAIVSSLPSIFMSLAQKVVDYSVDYSSENSDGELSVKGEEIQAEINKILSENGYSELQDLYDDEKVSKSELASCQEQATKYNEQVAIETEQIGIVDLKNIEIGEISSQVENLESELKNLDPIAENYCEEAARITTEVSEKRKQIAALEAERDEAQRKANEAGKKIENINIDEVTAKTTELQTKIQKIDGIINDIKPLLKSLKKSDGQDGRNVISNMTNNETKDIVGIINKINKAKANGDTEKEEKLNNQLKEAFEDYKKNHQKDDNKTIDNLMTKYGMGW